MRHGYFTISHAAILLAVKIAGMKYIIFILLLSPAFCDAQKDSVQYWAGGELARFSTIHTIGSTCEIAGVGLALLSTATIKNGVVANNTAAIASAGALVSFIGYIIEGTSYKHIKRAGIILQSNGIGIPIKYKKYYYQSRLKKQSHF